MKRSNDWSIRLKQEYINHNQKCLFITLTYDDDNLNIVKDIPYISEDDKLLFQKASYPFNQGIAVLKKRDIQLFNKRARHVLPNFTYFLVGEYGPTTLRPHYHALYFGLDMSSYELLSGLWTQGFVKINSVTPGRISYVSKYSLLPTHIPEFLRKKEYRPFMICSKGMGIQFLQTQQVHDMYNADDKLYYLDNGYKKSLPRYYRNKLFSEDKLKAFAEEYKHKTREMLNDFYVLEKNQTEFVTKAKRKKDWIEQHRYHVEEKLLKKSKL